MKLRSEETWAIPVVRINLVWPNGVTEKLPFGCNWVFLCLHQQLILVGRENFVFILLVYSDKKKQTKNFLKCHWNQQKLHVQQLWWGRRCSFQMKAYPIFFALNKTLLLMIRGFAWLFQGTECLVASHSLQDKAGMKISSLSKHRASPLLFFLWSCLPLFWHFFSSEIIFVLFQKHWCNRATGNIQGKRHFSQ